MEKEELPNNEKGKDLQRKKADKLNKKKKRKPSKLYKQSKIIQDIAAERIEYLMELAIKLYPEVPELSNRYIELVKNYSSGVKVPIPRKYKRYICHDCKKLMVPGYSCRIRIQSRKKNGSRLIITCLNCGHMVHLQFKNRKEKKNTEELTETIEEIDNDHEVE